MIRIMKYNGESREEIFPAEEKGRDVSAVVAQIIADVRTRRDAAVLDYEEKFDHVRLKSLQVTADEIAEAFACEDPEFLRVLKISAENIRNFHKRQVREGFIAADKPGIVLGQKIIPLKTVGIYVPGGTAAYPSTVLMNAIPAKIAGCPEIVMVTPPGPDGKVNPAILAAASVAGVDRIYKVGGAQAVAALAYGTESIPKVDKITGPGNAFVAEAKKQVYGTVNIDMIAGPSEILIVADGKSNPVNLAADMLSQAEHDRMASAVLITDSEETAKLTALEIDRQLKALPRKDIASESIEHNGRIFITKNIDEAIELSDRIAPEHLELCLDDPFTYLAKVNNAGSVFLGRNCPEAVGDYYAGPNHTLPTSGTARFSSALSVDDFVRKTQFIYYSAEAEKAVADDIALFAEKEGLRAHGRSATVRKEEE